MKNNIIAAIVAAGALGFGTQQASAAFINGAISISAPVTPNNVDLTVATLLDIDEANAAVQPGSQLGDFVGVSNGLAGVISFVSSMAINGPYGLPYQVYELDNGIVLVLTALTEINNTVDGIALDGDGVFMRPGYDDTFGDFDITVVRSNVGTTFAFNFATTSAVEGAVPDAGSSSMLLSLGALGLAALRRKLS